MLRVIFDTNIYGHLLEEPDASEIEDRIIDDKDFVVYGYQLIRKELRDVPKVTKLSRKARIVMLDLYDKITEGRFLRHSIKITFLAMKYYDHYRNLGGVFGWKTNIKVDFMLVACATFYNLDIVYSRDKRTLLSKPALKAYNHINLKENLRTPCFLSYKTLLEKYRRLF